MLTGVQTAESFIAWREEEGKKPQLARSTPTPITVELQKGSPELGMHPLVSFSCRSSSLLPLSLSLLSLSPPPPLPPSLSLPFSPTRSSIPLLPGIEIEGGVNRGAAEIRVKELKPGGAASMNNLLIKASVCVRSVQLRDQTPLLPFQPGCEIVEVDGNTLRGTKKREALQILNNAYRSDRPTLKITIIPV